MKSKSLTRATKKLLLQVNQMLQFRSCFLYLCFFYVYVFIDFIDLISLFYFLEFFFFFKWYWVSFIHFNYIILCYFNFVKIKLLLSPYYVIILFYYLNVYLLVNFLFIFAFYNSIVWRLPNPEGRADAPRTLLPHWLIDLEKIRWQSFSYLARRNSHFC